VPKPVGGQAANRPFGETRLDVPRRAPGDTICRIGTHWAVMAGGAGGARSAALECPTRAPSSGRARELPAPSSGRLIRPRSISVAGGAAGAVRAQCGVAIRVG